tara:strand:+ start:621 stop:800 length:180 start_codon:yes stop_codon:yes gene_type:complete
MSDSPIKDFEGLALKGQHIYALALHEVYPMKWSAFIRFFKNEEQQCVNETSLSVGLSYY